MNCELFFEINGSDEEQRAVALKIITFLKSLDDRGDICSFDGTMGDIGVESPNDSLSRIRK